MMDQYQKYLLKYSTIRLENGETLEVAASRHVSITQDADFKPLKYKLFIETKMLYVERVEIVYADGCEALEGTRFYRDDRHPDRNVHRGQSEEYLVQNFGHMRYVAEICFERPPKGIRFVFPGNVAEPYLYVVRMNGADREKYEAKLRAEREAEEKREREEEIQALHKKVGVTVERDENVINVFFNRLPDAADVSMELYHYAKYQGEKRFLGVFKPAEGMNFISIPGLASNALFAVVLSQTDKDGNVIYTGEEVLVRIKAQPVNMNAPTII